MKLDRSTRLAPLRPPPPSVARAPASVPNVPGRELHAIFNELMTKVIADPTAVTREVIARTVAEKSPGLSAADASTVTELILDQVQDYIAPEPVPAGVTVVSLSFSDTMGNQSKAIELMKKHGLVGVFYVNSPRISQNGKLSEKQLLDEQLRGSEVGGHTIDHDEIDGMSKSQQLHQVADDRYALMTRHAFWASSFGYPKSGSSTQAQSSVKQSNYNNARETGSLGRAIDEDIPARNPFNIRLKGSVKTPSLNELKKIVETSLESGGGWQIISFHGISDGGGSGYDTNYRVMDQFFGWLAQEIAAGRVQVRTPDQMPLRGEDGALVAGRLKPAITAREAAQQPGLSDSFE
jgi:peptidoglycan/xylan/chitin deacetylase (PgdA/CDA1 family)